MTRCWLRLADDDPWGLDNLPYGAVRTTDGRQVAAARIGEQVLDLTALGGFDAVFAAGTLDAFLAAGPRVWREVRAALTAMLTDGAQRTRVEPLLLPLAQVSPVLPFTVADYVDFYASEHHATNVGRIFRPDGAALTPNWKHLPIGYHGRSGTVVVSGTDVVRPAGQARDPDGTVRFGPSRRLDIEAEVAFVVGTPSPPNRPVPVRAFTEHVFGLALLNDWSARDIQAWEYVPLGPFLGKSFATSLAAWITPLEALSAAWVAPPPRDPAPLPYLDDSDRPYGLDLTLTVELNGTVISRPPFAAMYWTPAQMLAHMTVNGAHLRTGDLYASGTVSGPEQGQRGCLLELTWAGSEPVRLADGSHRSFLQDGDEVVLTATAPGPHGPIALGEVRGRISSSRS
ncbi:MAG: fumarylacetoacetase [Jatrophihabitans sp.]|nr:MAG: fumarylacetoacetase [Jatrophihabitans sp.]